ncbi:MAG: hypothetical protein RLZZ624_486 [Cyanobacteriota bacterium]|jgi:hypothetical protein
MDPARLQATLVDFAIGELVRQHRASFQPLWTADSWAKLMIWLALNCGCSGDESALRTFAEALGPSLCARMRHLFFSRELERLDLQLMADPAEPQVLVLPLGPDPSVLSPETVAAALEQVQLLERVQPSEHWQQLEGAVAIPWAGAL